MFESGLSTCLQTVGWRWLTRPDTRQTSGLLPNNMISSFLRSTRNLSSVHSGSGSGCGPLRSSSDPGRGESALHSLLDPLSDCGKYPDKESHWAAMTLRYSFSRGPIIHGAARRSQQTLGATPREKFHVSSAEKSAAPPRNTSEPPPFGSKLCRNLCKISVFGAFVSQSRAAEQLQNTQFMWAKTHSENQHIFQTSHFEQKSAGFESLLVPSGRRFLVRAAHQPSTHWFTEETLHILRNSGRTNQTKLPLASGMSEWAPVQVTWNRSVLHI